MRSRQITNGTLCRSRMKTMNENTLVTIQRVREQESKNTQNRNPKPNKTTKLQFSSLPSEDAKSEKTTTVLRPLWSTNQTMKVTKPNKATKVQKSSPNQYLKPLKELGRKKIALKRLAMDGTIPSQSPQAFEIIANGHAERLEQQMQDRPEGHNIATPADGEGSRKPCASEVEELVKQQMQDYTQEFEDILDATFTCVEEERELHAKDELSKMLAQKLEQQMQDFRDDDDCIDIAHIGIDRIEKRRRITSCEVAHDVPFEQLEHLTRDCRKVEDRYKTPELDTEGGKKVKGEPAIPLPRNKMNNKTSCGSHEGCADVAALSLEEYYLSGGKMIPPAIHDFIGPIKITRVGEGRGRGLVLSQEVAAGDLLLVTNHIAKVSRIKTNIIDDTFSFHSTSWTGSHILADELVSILSSQAWRSPHNRAILSTLCSRGGEELPVPPMRLFRHNNNTPRTTTTDLGATSFDQLELMRLCGVVQCNAFGHTHTTKLESRNNNTVTQSWSCGLWPLPSFLNHSCLPNVATIVVGDAMIVIASRNLKVGEELTVAYFDVFRPLHERRSSMLHSWSFTCSCARCALESRLQEPLHRITHAYSLREAEVALQGHRSHQNVPREAHNTMIDLVQLVEALERAWQHEKLSRDEKNWLRASYVSAYLADDGGRLMVDVRALEEPRKRRFVRKTHLQAALGAAKAVTPGHPQTLMAAAAVLRRAVAAYGRQSFFVRKARQRALAVCASLFGRQREHVLESIVEGIFEHSFFIYSV